MRPQPEDMAAGLKRQTVKGTLEAKLMVLCHTSQRRGCLQVSSQGSGPGQGQWSQKRSWGALELVTQAAPGAGHVKVTEAAGESLWRLPERDLHSSWLTMSSGTSATDRF